MDSRSLSDLRGSTIRGAKLLAVLGLVLMVVIAGCSGLNPLGSGDPPSDEKTETDRKTKTSEVTYPAGFSPEGVTDPEKAAQNHNKKLSEHDSFTQNVELNTVISGVEASGKALRKADVKNKHSHVVHDVKVLGQTFRHYESYQSEGTEYTMNQSSGGDVTYNVSERPFNLNDTRESTEIRDRLESANFGKAKEIRRDGKTVLRYKAKNTSNADPFIIDDSVSNPTVSDFNATLFVAQNGIIQEFRYSITYSSDEMDQQTDSVTYKTTNLDSTTVEKPDWVDEAKAQSSIS